MQPPETEQRKMGLLEAVYLTAGLAWFLVILWERFDPDGPRDLWARLRAIRYERERYKIELRETLESIRDLPEAGDS